MPALPALMELAAPVFVGLRAVWTAEEAAL